MKVRRAGLALALLSLSCTAHAPLRSVPGAVVTSSERLARPEGRREAASHSVEVHPNFTLAFVEFDDQGRFWNRGQLDSLERMLEEESIKAAGGGVVVAVYAHGWEHDSGVCDENVACFREFLAQISRDSDAIARLSGRGLPPRRIVGVYVGWRGRSVTVRVLRELTFWARKRVALRIGGGDLIELLTRIDGFVKKSNADGKDHARMITLGHSFGGTMVYTALANILKSRLVEALGRQGNPDPHANLVEGFGDLVVLVNPAFEASLFLTLHDLSKSLKKLSPLQKPVLITVESETDRPNRVWFRLGQTLATLFNRSASSAERASMRTAVGNYPEFWDYRLTLAPGEKPDPPHRSDSFGLRSGDCRCDLKLATSETEIAHLVSLLYPSSSPSSSDPRPAPPEPAAAARYGRAELTCLIPQDRRSPFWVVRASDDVIRGHNGIFTNAFIDFTRGVIIESMAKDGRAGR